MSFFSNHPIHKINPFAVDQPVNSQLITVTTSILPVVLIYNIKMKILRSILFIAVVTCLSKTAVSQDVMLNIMTQQSGAVQVNGNIFLEVMICNTNAATAVPAYKLRPQISFPADLVSIPDSGHVLPPGWTLTFNKNAVVRISNGIDQIPASGCRTILILMKAIGTGGPSTISGNLGFSNGIAPGSVSGSTLPGDNPADNISTSTIKVIN